MPGPVLDRIRTLLRDQGVEFREIHHEPTYTSEESARARGEDIRIGGKALLLKLEDEFGLFVFSAARKLDSGAIRRHFGIRKLRFATTEELEGLTGLVPGGVPPFGRPVLPFPLFADPSVLSNERIAFNAGSLTDSIVMSSADWRRIAEPQVFAFTQAV
jgi:prolyl-tRNA editing enzyme YbaK/EbsC (Cys-tRNA(Pro) deacylase)